MDLQNQSGLTQTGTSSNRSTSTSTNEESFPVGSIIAIFSEVESFDNGRYLLCNGQTFDQDAFPELYQILGGNQVPDLRGQQLKMKAQNSQQLLGTYEENKTGQVDILVPGQNIQTQAGGQTDLSVTVSGNTAQANTDHTHSMQIQGNDYAPLLVCQGTSGFNLDATGGDNGGNNYDVKFQTYAQNVAGTRQNTGPMSNPTTHNHSVNLSSTPQDISHSHTVNIPQQLVTVNANEKNLVDTMLLSFYIKARKSLAGSESSLPTVSDRIKFGSRELIQQSNQVLANSDFNLQGIYRITNTVAPIQNNDLTTKLYVDQQIGLRLQPVLTAYVQADTANFNTLTQNYTQADQLLQTNLTAYLDAQDRFLQDQIDQLQAQTTNKLIDGNSVFQLNSGVLTQVNMTALNMTGCAIYTSNVVQTNNSSVVNVGHLNTKLAALTLNRIQDNPLDYCEITADTQTTYINGQAKFQLTNSEIVSTSTFRNIMRYSPSVTPAQQINDRDLISRDFFFFSRTQYTQLSFERTPVDANVNTYFAIHQQYRWFRDFNTSFNYVLRPLTNCFSVQQSSNTPGISVLSQNGFQNIIMQSDGYYKISFSATFRVFMFTSAQDWESYVLYARSYGIGQQQSAELNRTNTLQVGFCATNGFLEDCLHYASQDVWPLSNALVASQSNDQGVTLSPSFDGQTINVSASEKIVYLYANRVYALLFPAFSTSSNLPSSLLYNRCYPINGHVLIQRV